MSIETVNTIRSLKKATDRSGIKNDNSSTTDRLSWYQSIDRKLFRLYVKFEGRMSIPFTRKMMFKNSGNFFKRTTCPFSKVRICNRLIAWPIFSTRGSRHPLWVYVGELSVALGLEFSPPGRILTLYTYFSGNLQAVS
jgi:hypothetical protein